MDPDPRQYDPITLRERDIHDIVLSYLVHNCFMETAESFVGCSRMSRSTDVMGMMMDMIRRRSILTHALEGDALKAIELTGELAPKLLEENQDLYFDLLSLHFVNLVHSRKCTEALEFAQTMLTPFGKVPKYVEKLEDFMALLAYEEPEKSPMFHLLGQEHRENVAHSLNRAILVGVLPLFFLHESICDGPRKKSGEKSWYLTCIPNFVLLPTSDSTLQPAGVFFNGKANTTSNRG